MTLHDLADGEPVTVGRLVVARSGLGRPVLVALVACPDCGRPIRLPWTAGTAAGRIEPFPWKCGPSRGVAFVVLDPADVESNRAAALEASAAFRAWAEERARRRSRGAHPAFLSPPA